MRIRGAVLDRIGDPFPFEESRPLRVVELELDDPGPTEVLVEIEAAGVCHSDLSVVDGNRSRPVPMLLGHEAAGLVRAVGAEVTDLPLGTRVVMTFLPRCGACAGCLTDGMAPCQPGSVANGAGVLLAGAIRGAGCTTGPPRSPTTWVSPGSRRTPWSTVGRSWSSTPTSLPTSPPSSAVRC